jgi:putative membrane protein
MGFLVRLIVNAAALWVAAYLIPGVAIADLTALALAALVLGIINAVVRPVLVVLTFPLTLVTLGLFLFVLNAFCLWLTSRLVPGFDIQSFGAALLGSLVISVVSWVLTTFVSDTGRWRRLDARR